MYDHNLPILMQRTFFLSETAKKKKKKKIKIPCLKHSDLPHDMVSVQVAQVWSLIIHDI